MNCTYRRLLFGVQAACCTYLRTLERSTYRECSTTMRNELTLAHLYTLIQILNAMDRTANWESLGNVSGRNGTAGGVWEFLTIMAEKVYQSISVREDFLVSFSTRLFFFFLLRMTVCPSRYRPSCGVTGADEESPWSLKPLIPPCSVCFGGGGEREMKMTRNVCT